MQQIIFPFLGNSRVMALVILVHVFFAFVAVGGICLAFASEWLGYGKGSAFHDRFARGYIGFLSDMMKVNGVLGAAIVVLLIGLFPAFSTRLYNIFFWPLVLEVALFLAMMVSTVVYANTWETARSRGLHLAVGGLCAAFAVSAGLVINAAHSFMLTPGGYFDDPRLMNAVFNPSMTASSLHLLIPCIANAAMFAYIHALFRLRGAGDADRDYYSWTADYCGSIFAWGILLQPLSGLSYLFTLKGVDQKIFDSITGGAVAGFFWPMAGLAALAVTCALIYLLSGRKRRAVILLGGAAALTAFSFGGYTRERARKPYLIYGHMYMTGAPAGPRPAPDRPAAAPAPVETNVAQRSPKKAPGIKAPSAASLPAAPEEAPPAPGLNAALDRYGCIVCHAYKGEGGTFGPAIDEHLRHHSKEALKKILKDPAPTMPPFEGTDKELDDLVDALKQQ